MSKLEEKSKDTIGKLTNGIDLEQFLVLSEKNYLEKITILNCCNSNLKELPPNLKLPNLKELNLSHNVFESVPSCLFNDGISKLEILDMSFNKIRQFDTEPCSIYTLRKLELNNNNFTIVPKWFSEFRCTNLEYFNYSNNQAIQYNFKKHNLNFVFMKLKNFILSNACLIDEDFYWLRNFSNLQFLDISNNEQFSVIFLNKFYTINQLFLKPKWDNLQVLNVNCLNISLFPEGIMDISSLKELYIAHNSISWFSDGLDKLINLQILDVSENQLLYVPKEIGSLLNLKVFIASSNRIENIPPLPLNIEVVDFYDNHLETLENINLNSIQLVDLDFNYIEYSEILDLDAYRKKRDTLRNRYRVYNRYQCNKNPAPKFDESVSTYSTDSDSNSNDSQEYQCNFDDHSENWDEDKTPEFLNTCHPHITLSDNEFDGNISLENKISRYEQFINDDDWMFVDAD